MSSTATIPSLFYSSKEQNDAISILHTIHTDNQDSESIPDCTTAISMAGSPDLLFTPKVMPDSGDSDSDYDSAQMFEDAGYISQDDTANSNYSDDDMRTQTYQGCCYCCGDCEQCVSV